MTDGVGRVNERTVNSMTDDTIRRQAMINEIDANVGVLYDSPSLVASLKKMVMALPSAQPERKNARWRTAYLDHEGLGIRPKIHYCSECSWCATFSTHYCPNCGADMR